MSFFYLELNPFIVAGSRIRKIDLSKGTVYTSSWAISEQIINLSQKNFAQIKSSFRLIHDIEIAIDWETNLEKMYTAFGLQSPRGNIKDLIRGIYQDILEKASFDELNLFSRVGIHELAKMRSLNALVESVKRQTFDEFGLAAGRTGNSVEAAKDLIYQTTLGLLSLEFGIDRLELNGMYNGRLDRYLHAQAVLEVKKTEKGRNDQFDAEHFKYLQNKVTYMVSDDRLVHEMDSKKVFGVQEFLDYMGAKI